MTKNVMAPTGTLTAARLIEVLQTLPPETTVWVGNGMGSSRASEIEVVNDWADVYPPGPPDALGLNGPATMPVATVRTSTRVVIR